MSDDARDERPQSATGSAERPPLGSWRLTYVIVCVCATVTIALLWWLTASFDLGPAK